MSRTRSAPHALTIAWVCFIAASSGVPAALAQPAAAPLYFAGEGHTVYGDWHAQGALSHSVLAPGQAIRIDVSLRLSDTHLAALASAGIKADSLCLLVTGERTFDADGWMRLPSDERMSTLLTPTGLPIEGGTQGAVTNRYGYKFGSPIDELTKIPATQTTAGDAAGTRMANFSVQTTLPAALPPGLYRLRFDLGVMVGTRVYNLNGFGFAARPSTNQAGTSTYFYSPVVPASGTHVSGRQVDATRLQARFPWVLLANYNSNGYRGVVADEDRGRFALSGRSLIQDDVILPMVDDNGARLSYSLEPQFPADTIDPIQNIPWTWSSGELSVTIIGPDGSTVSLGTAKFSGKSGSGPTTKNAAFTSWRPPRYGQYTVRAAGWITDDTGRRYEGGGTYRFWIAKRMTLATATFQGMPYPVGASYGRDIQFNPPVPADVRVTASLHVNSDVANVRTLTYTGKASPAGLFGAAQGMKPFPLNAPGEYHGHVLATYTDAGGHLWVSTMRHAGIVYPESSAVVARGKKVVVAGASVDRGETKFEGHLEANGDPHLAHIAFPYLAGDVLLIAAEGAGANKIEPVLTYQMKGDSSAWDTTLNAVGTTNLRITTSNGYSPHLFPEYITGLEYYYGAAPRPGFMGRFLVGESTVRAPYWPVSPNTFGGQIGASANGDAPGDIYRLLGGVVLRRPGQAPMYAGYIASAFLLPGGTNNNRVVAPGSEDLHGPLGTKARFFLVGLRPGTAFEVGSTFRPAVQIDPLLPVSIRFVLTHPDGRQQTAEGAGDAAGSFAGPTAWPLDVPGIYRYQLRANWNGYEGRMPGLPESGGEFYVYSKTRPAGASGLRIEGPASRTFSASAGTTIAGTSSADTVRYALLTPGAVIEQGDLPVRGGRFEYVFDPAAVHARVPLYDIVSITTGKPQIGRVIHLTFFSAERVTGGGTFHDVARVILRGTTVIAPPTTPAQAQAASVEASARASAHASDASAGAGTESPGARQPHAYAGPVRVSVSDPGTLRAWDAFIDRSIDAGDLRLVSRAVDTVLPTRLHERLQQFHEGVPVFGGELTRQIDRGLTVSVFGVLYRDVDVEAAPVVDADGARLVAERHSRGRTEPDGTAELMVLPTDAGGYTLAWRSEARTGTDVRVVFVDAVSGRIALEYSNLATQQAVAMHGRGLLGDTKRLDVSAWAGTHVAMDRSRGATITTFDLGGDAERAMAAVSGLIDLGAADVAANPGSRWTDGAVVDAHAYMAATYDYFLQRFNRRSLDGHDMPIAALVHPAGLEDWETLGSRLGVYYANAFWNGRVAVFGDGLPPGVARDGRTWTPTAAALDIVAHELAHAVIGFSSGLIRRGESGALSEAFADIMATGAEFFAQPAGPGPRRADYHVGEDAVSGGGLRSLEDPAASGHADHWASRRPVEDADAISVNSTIASHAFYLAVEGGRNRSSGATVAGVGRANREMMEKVFYRAFVYLLPSGGDFATARAATIQSAKDLAGAGSAAERAVTEAWTAVGIE